MKHIEIFEAIDIKKYNEFIKKYNKTGYISTKSSKILKEIGLDVNFKKIQDKIRDCFNFYSKQDIPLLEDLLLHLKDDTPIHMEIGNISLSMNISPSTRKYDSLNPFDILIYDKTLLKNEKAVIDDIIQRVEDIRYAKEVEYERREREDINKRPGVRNYSTLQLNSVRIGNYYQKIEIKPEINIQFTFSELFNPDRGWPMSEETKERYKIYDDIVKYLKEDTIDRYFRAIGINTTFNITYNSNGFYHIENQIYKISLKDTQGVV
jgi:hypothetical protein